MIKKIAYNLLSLLFKPFPRNKHLWVTGKITSWEFANNPPAFFDNSKHFFLYLVNNTDEKVYWLSSSDEEIKMLKEYNLPVVKYPSIKGIWLVLRAKFSFHHYGSDQINYWFQRGSVQLNFWHGTPIKMIGYDIREKIPLKHNFYLDLMRKGGEEYVFSTSKFVSEKIFERAFDIGQEHLLNFGYPRMDVMGLSEEENIEFCRKYSPELIKYIEIAKSYKKVFLYMPTYREDDPSYFEKANVDFEKMSKALEAADGVFFLKLHPLTKSPGIKDYKNIIQIGNDVDIYPFLIYTTYLVTDYSSIVFDYLMLDKEMIFIPYDMEDYVSQRKLYFDYDEVTPGVKYSSFSEFIDSIPGTGSLDYSEDRKRVREKMIDDYDFDASERTYRFIKERYKL